MHAAVRLGGEDAEERVLDARSERRTCGGVLDADAGVLEVVVLAASGGW